MSDIWEVAKRIAEWSNKERPMRCDLCNKPITKMEENIIPLWRMQTVVSLGFNPWKTPGIDMPTYCDPVALTNELKYKNWYQFVMNDTADWGLCNSCASAFQKATGVIPQFSKEGNVSFTFNVQTPEGTNDVYISGPFNGWNPKRDHLSRLSTGIWTITLEMPKDEVAEYKYTQGSWETVETAANQSFRPNRRIAVKRDNSGEFRIDDIVEEWKKPPK